MSASRLWDEFQKFDSCKNAFSFEAFERILEIEEEVAIDCTGDESGTIDFDPIALNCTYTEESVDDFLDTYSNLFERDKYVDEDGEIDTEALIEDVYDHTHTFRVELLDNGNLLYGSF